MTTSPNSPNNKLVFEKPWREGQSLFLTKLFCSLQIHFLAFPTGLFLLLLEVLSLDMNAVEQGPVTAFK